jgi:hypothetical protein
MNWIRILLFTVVPVGCRLGNPSANCVPTRVNMRSPAVLAVKAGNRALTAGGRQSPNSTKAVPARPEAISFGDRSKTRLTHATFKGVGISTGPSHGHEVIVSLSPDGMGDSTHNRPMSKLNGRSLER